MCAAIEQVACKPTQGKRWRVAAPKQHRTCPHQIVYDRAVEFGDEVFLQPAAICRGESCLVDVYFDSDRHAGQGARVVPAGQHTVHPVCLLSHLIRSAVNNCVDLRVDGVEALQRCVRYLTSRHFERPYEASDFACRQLPEFIHRISFLPKSLVASHSR
jgi:hypothetical protein